MPKAPSFVAAPQGPATAAQPSHDIVAAPTVADATPLKDTAQPAPAKTVGSDELPTELSARVSLGNMPELPALASVSANAAQPAKQASTELTAGAPVNLPIVASPAASQVPDFRRCSRGLAAAGRDAKRDSVALRHGLRPRRRTRATRRRGPPNRLRRREGRPPLLRSPPRPNPFRPRSLR